VRTHGDLLEDHIRDLLESKQPDVMAKIITLRIMASEQADKEIQFCLNELLPERRQEFYERSEDLMEVNSWIIESFGKTSTGIDELVQYMKRKKLLKLSSTGTDLDGS